MEFNHYSVLLQETLENLKIKENGIYVDGTLGGAGHSCEILKRLKKGKLIGIDRDLEAIEVSASRLEPLEKSNEVILLHGNHENIPELLNSINIKEVDGVLLDLGISSYQIDNGERGFSYMNNAKLDMRMDQTQTLDAKYIINNYSESELIKIFKEYGEEKFASKIAKKIVFEREIKEIETTFELVSIIDEVKPFSKKGHKSKQVFQALRIEVNGELKKLEEAIFDIANNLKNKGRFCIITFHSLEDKAVKKAFKKLEGECICPKDLPVCVCGFKSYGKIITKKGIIPSKKELMENSRSKSAKLRVFERIK